MTIGVDEMSKPQWLLTGSADARGECHRIDQADHYSFKGRSAIYADLANSIEAICSHPTRCDFSSWREADAKCCRRGVFVTGESNGRFVFWHSAERKFLSSSDESGTTAAAGICAIAYSPCGKLMFYASGYNW